MMKITSLLSQSLYSLLIVLSSFLFTDVFAAPKTFTGTGSFSNAGNWNAGTLPVAGDDLTISGICTVDNNAGTNNVAYGNLVIGVTATQVLKWPVGGTNKLNVYGVDGIGILDMTNGGTLIVREIIHDNFTFIPGTGTVERRFPTLNTTLPWTFNNLVINPGAGQVISTGIAIIVNGNLTVTGGTFSIGGFNFTVGGTTTINSGCTLAITSITGAKSFKDLIINGTFANNTVVEPITISGNLTNNGTFNQGTGRVTFTGAASDTISGTAASTAFGGGITVNKGASTSNVLDVQSVITLLAGGLKLTNGTFELSSASVITPFTANIPITPFLIPATAGLWCNGGTINTTVSMLWTIGGLLRISAGILNQGLAVNDRLQPKTGASIIVEGGNMNCAAQISSTPLVWSFAMTGGTLTIGTAGNSLPNLAVFDMDQLANSFSMSGGTMIIESPGGGVGENLGYYNLSTSGSGFTGGTLQIGDASTPAGDTIKILTARPIYNLTVNGVGVTAQIDSFAVTTVSNNVTIAAGELSANSLDINVGGNWTNNSVFTATAATVTFNGTGTKSVGGISLTSFYNLKINTSAISDIVQLTNNTKVTSGLTLTKGVLDLNSKQLNVTNGLSTAITRTSGYILSEKTDNSSKIKWLIGTNLTSHTYPFGTASGSYIPFILNVTAGNIGNVTVATYPTPVNNTPFPTAPILVTNLYGSTGADNSANTVDRFWQITKEGPSGTATITFTATAAEVGTILLPTAQRYETLTNKWQAPLSGQTSTATSATVPGVTTFSPWTLSSQAAMLPIQLVSFNAAYINPFVSLTWVTESEANSDYFTIEKTTDEKSFETVCQVKAAGESFQTLNYQTTDMHPASGLSYYRLKKVDRDGTASYSDLVAIKVATLSDQISISPNPVTNGMITIQVPNQSGETLNVSVIDMNGKILFANTNKLGEAQQSSIVIDRLGNLPKGLYILKIASASEIFNKKITIY